MKLQYKFVEFMPSLLEDGIVYISMEYGTAIHQCVCGCGNKVVTPISPTGWQLTYDGESITLNPSIGNWSFECQTHYWIINSSVRYASKWNEDEIKKARKKEKKTRTNYFKKCKQKK